MTLSTAKKIAILEEYGFTIGDRDPRLNTNYPGSLMAVEATVDDIGDYELPTEDGANGPWCYVGDDLEDIVKTAYDDYLSSLDAPGFDEVVERIANTAEADLPERQNTSLGEIPAQTPTP